MLSEEMIQLIQNHTAGMVATTNDDGTPAVSPKATFFVMDETTIAFGNLRSPGTIANLRKRPAVEVNFIDVVYRKAVRIKGTARFVRPGDGDEVLAERFLAGWPDLAEVVAGYVVIDVTAAEMIVSPAYDRGATEADLRAANLAKLNAL